jgi:hypothetical protein
MAGSSKQKKALAATMAMYFAEKGYIGNSSRPPQYFLKHIKRIFGSWSMMVKCTTQWHRGDVMSGISTEKPVEKEVKPTIAVKMDKAKPASKAESEVVDGKDI